MQRLASVRLRVRNAMTWSRFVAAVIAVTSAVAIASCTGQSDSTPGIAAPPQANSEQAASVPGSNLVPSAPPDWQLVSANTVSLNAADTREGMTGAIDAYYSYTGTQVQYAGQFSVVIETFSTPQETQSYGYGNVGPLNNGFRQSFDTYTVSASTVGNVGYNAMTGQDVVGGTPPREYAVQVLPLMVNLLRSIAS